MKKIMFLLAFLSMGIFGSANSKKIGKIIIAKKNALQHHAGH
jgi:hypothetical protein